MSFMHCIQVLCTVPKHYNNILLSNNTARTTAYILHTPFVHYSTHRRATTGGFCTPKFPISKNGSNRTYFLFCIERSTPKVLKLLLPLRKYPKQPLIAPQPRRSIGTHTFLNIRFGVLAKFGFLQTVTLRSNFLSGVTLSK